MEDLVFGVISLDMVIGMALGMAASPLLMKAVKILRRRMKINRILKEIARDRKGDIKDSDAMMEGLDN